MAMQLPRVRFTVRRMMLAVAIMAGLFGYMNFVWSILPSVKEPFWQLSSGQSVELIADCEGWVLRDPALIGSGSRIGIGALSSLLRYSKGGVVSKYPEGTLAVVTVDSGDSDDSTSRPVAIKIVGGPFRGSVVAVPRGSLRER